MQRFFILISLVLLFKLASGQNFTSSNLPIVIINTNGQVIVDEPKIPADMGIIYNGPGIRNNVNDPFNNYSGKVGIEIRGQSSQMFPMKSYSVDLWDASGNSINRSILGMPSESDWVLYAPYTDKTLMRNFLAYTISREMGRWAARCHFVEVVINGDYKGIYVLMEKIKRNSNRVNITKINPIDISGDVLTGGYIFSLDKEPDGWFSTYPIPYSLNNAYRRYTYVYPKLENIVQPQKDYIKSYVDSFEHALAGPDYQDPVKGVRKFADLPSFIDFFIVNEVSRNVDGYRLSSFFYKDRNSKNGKIFAGPVWDYDLAFRNANYCSGSNVTGWAYQFNNVCPGDGAGLVPFWWEKFQTDSAFKSSLRCRWKQVRQTSLSDQRINFLIDSVNNLVSEAQQRHFQRWQILGKYVWPNPDPIPNSYAGEISTLKAWTIARLKWIDESIPNSGACFDYPPDEVKSVLINVFPNPVEKNITVRVQSRFNQFLTVNVFDAMGRNVFKQQYSLFGGDNLLYLNSTSWSSGIYFFNYQSEKGEKGVSKLLKF